MHRMPPTKSMARRNRAALLALAVSLFPISSNAGQPKDCKVLSKWAAMVMVYCPAQSDAAEVGSWLKSIKDSHMAPPGRQVHFHVFTSEKKAPTSAKEFFALPDDEYDKLVIARADFNENTGNREFACRKKPSDKSLVPCSELIR